MSFSTLIFVSVFLPVFLLLHTIIPGSRGKNLVLLLASILFYAYAGLLFLPIPLIMAGVACVGGYQIEAGRGYLGWGENLPKSRRWLVATIIILLFLLCLFKYSSSIFEFFPSLQKGVSSILPWAGLGDASFIFPLGISFYTFKLISYVVDIYREKIKAENYGRVLLYTLMFPQVSQGPIARYGQMEEAFGFRRFDIENFTEGLSRFIIGLSKKTLLANHAGEMAESLLPLGFLEKGQAISTQGAWFGMFFYILELYLDFSAYTDMAIGIGKACGFEFPENFNYPILANSVRDFWRRWHLTLSGFFRDYVYIPLGGNRVNALRLCLNLLIVWLLTGVWHGNSVNYILWGLYFFAFVGMENIFKVLFPTLERQTFTIPGTIAKGIFSHIYAFFALFFSFIFFRFPDIASISAAFHLLFALDGTEIVNESSGLIIQNNIFFFIVCIIGSTPLVKIIGMRIEKGVYREAVFRRRVLGNSGGRFGNHLNDDFGDNSYSAAHLRVISRIRARRMKRAKQAVAKLAIFYAAKILIFIMLLVLSIMSMVGSSYTPFMYNQF